MSKAEICKVPETLKFQFQEDQEMNSSITIENLMDTLVKYKVAHSIIQIKTNKPGLYLVKPMGRQLNAIVKYIVSGGVRCHSHLHLNYF